MSPASAQRFQPMPVPDLPRGTLTRAWDNVFQRPAAVKSIPAGLTGNRVGQRLTELWEAWYGAPHPALLRPGLLDFQQNVLTREWAHGFSLLALLRQRRKLKAGEALAILAQLAPALDFAERQRLLQPISLDKIFIAFPALKPEESPTALYLEKPMEQWGPWALKVDPLRLAALFEPSGSDELQTAPGAVVTIPTAASAVLTALTLTRQLLGAPMSKLDAPCAALREAGNQVLSAALQAGRFSQATAFQEALRAALPDETLPQYSAVPAEEIEVIGAAAGLAQPSAPAYLWLEPLQTGLRGVRLVLADKMRIGRSSTEADCAVRFPSTLPEHERLAVSVSRRHATLRREGRSLCLLDGADGRPSRNGTFARSGRIEWGSAFLLEGPSAVQLGAHWRATVHPVLRSQAAPQFRPENKILADEAETPWQAVHLAPWKGCATKADAVWLLMEAGFGFDEDGALMWDMDGWASAPAAFCRWGAEVLLVNRRLAELEVSLAGVKIEPGTARVLRGGETMKLGPHEWRLEFPQAASAS